MEFIKYLRGATIIIILFLKDIAPVLIILIMLCGGMMFFTTLFIDKTFAPIYPEINTKYAGVFIAFAIEFTALICAMQNWKQESLIVGTLSGLMSVAGMFGGIPNDIQILTFKGMSIVLGSVVLGALPPVIVVRLSHKLYVMIGDLNIVNDYISIFKELTEKFFEDFRNSYRNKTSKNITVPFVNSNKNANIATYQSRVN